MARNRSRSRSDITFPDWQRPLLEALLETDLQKVQQHIFSLEDEIVKRMELHADTPDAEADEKISVSLRTLRVLQIEKMKYPDC